MPSFSSCFRAILAIPRGLFKGSRATFPAKTFEDEKTVLPVEPKKAAVPHPDVPAPIPEKPTAEIPDVLTLTPKAPDLAKQFVNQKPDVNASSKVVPSQEKSVQSELDSTLTRQLLDNQPANPHAHAAIKLPKGGGDGGTGLDGAGGNGAYSNLDSLLEKSGPLKGPVGPVMMPGGALFEYDSAVLLPDAITTLRKLGELVTRNPRARFSIEGHTDSVGSPEYNLKLSIARAEAVKEWLVREMHLDPARIQAKGLGNTRLIAPATGSRAEQAMNRRVEIVIRTPKN